MQSISMGSLVSSCLSGGNPMLMFSGFPSGSLSVSGLCTLQQPYAFRSNSLFMLTCNDATEFRGFFFSCRSLLGCVQALGSLLLTDPLSLA